MENIDCQIFMENAKKLAEKQNAESAIRYKQEREAQETVALEKLKITFPQLKFVREEKIYGKIYDVCGHYFSLCYWPVEGFSPYKPDWIKWNHDWCGYAGILVYDEKTFGDYLIWAEQRTAELKQEIEARNQREQNQKKEKTFLERLFG